jgi:hypothetical protein
MRMPRYDVSNEGMGPYANFYCDRCDRNYRSQPSIGQQIKENVTRGALGGFLRNVPIVGDSVANEMENDRYRTTLTAEELATAWGQVEEYFRECPTCHQIVCIPDFDDATGYCDEDSPRATEVAQAQAEQAGAALRGFADALGLSGAIQQGMAQAQAQQAQPAQVQQGQAPQQGGASAAAGTCASCGSALAPGARFCANCGTAVPQAKFCPSCGAQASGPFCANCGTKIA